MEDIEYLKKQAKNVRKGIIEAVYNGKSGHPGGSLSIADIMTVLYFKEMNINPENPKDENRDRLVLSKGHCAPALYSTLANRGFFDIKELTTLRHIDSNLQGHPDMNKVPGVDMTTGSLGQGLSSANGMAIAGKMDNKNYNFVPHLEQNAWSFGISLPQQGQLTVSSGSSGCEKNDGCVLT